MQGSEVVMGSRNLQKEGERKNSACEVGDWSVDHSGPALSPPHPVCSPRPVSCESQFSLSPVWILGIRLRWSGVAAAAFSHLAATLLCSVFSAHRGILLLPRASALAALRSPCLALPHRVPF